MDARSIRNLTLYFDAGEEAAAEIIAAACERSLDLIHDLWELQAPEDCRVYVMTSWRDFLFHSAPRPWRIYLRAALPLRRARIQRTWGMAGGWALRYGRRRAIGIKPPRLLADIDPGLRDRVFIRREPDEWAQHNTCHELVHACSDHLRLPTWLHEGLAMLTVDRLAGRPTVTEETLSTLAGEPQQGRAGLIPSPERLVYLAVRGYWITRYIAKTDLGLLRGQLARRQSHAALETALAAGLGMDRQEFWARIDGNVLSHLAPLARFEMDAM